MLKMVVKVASTSTKTSTEKVMESATVTVVCYKWKTLSNGENPLMLRVKKLYLAERHNFQHSADKRNAQRDKKEISFTRWQFLVSLITQDLWQTGLHHEWGKRRTSIS